MPVRRAHEEDFPWVPTTIVSGLGSDSIQFPFLHLFDPLDEELETISEKDEGTSSADESAASMDSMDEEEASLELDSEIPLPEHMLHKNFVGLQSSILQLEANQEPRPSSNFKGTGVNCLLTTENLLKISC
ncbi:hypothetical protein Dimus_038446 [Dionaea muscipula]